MPSHKIHLSIVPEVNKKLKLDNDSIMLGSVLPDLTIEHNKNFKHNFFDSYDRYLLKHKKVNKFTNIDVINQIPFYKDISFDIEYLKSYINKLNSEIDNTYYDENFKVDYQDFLDELYNGCIKYIFDNIDKGVNHG